MNAFLFPGLGQIYLGRKKRGWVFILLTFSVLIFTFAKYSVALFKVIEIRHPRPPAFNLVQNLIAAYQMEKTLIGIGVSILLLCWIGSMVEIYRD